MTPELVRKLLRYDESTGKLYWRKRGVGLFSDGKYSARAKCLEWNSRYSGKETFASSGSRGYLCGAILGTSYRTHRVIWALVHGVWPDQIDHINGVRNDNRISNLRDVSNAENSRNQKMRNTNISGIIGVCWDNASGKWLATISVVGKQKTLGRFSDIQEAAEVRAVAETKYGYHENHGRKQKSTEVIKNRAIA